MGQATSPTTQTSCDGSLEKDNKIDGITVHKKKKKKEETELYELDTDPKAFTLQHRLPALKGMKLQSFSPGFKPVSEGSTIPRPPPDQSS